MTVCKLCGRTIEHRVVALDGFTDDPILEWCHDGAVHPERPTFACPAGASRHEPAGAHDWDRRFICKRCGERARCWSCLCGDEYHDDHFGPCSGKATSS